MLMVVVPGAAVAFPYKLPFLQDFRGLVQDKQCSRHLAICWPFFSMAADAFLATQ